MAESEGVATVARGGGGNVMFDVDAIRREALQLALEGGDLEEIKRDLRVREIEGTLGVLKVTTPTKTTENGVAMADAPAEPESKIRTAAVSGLANGHSTPAKQTQDEYDHDHEHESHEHNHEHAEHGSDITMSFEAPARRPSYGASSRHASYIMTGEEARPSTPTTISRMSHRHDPPTRDTSPQVASIVPLPLHEGTGATTRTPVTVSAEPKASAQYHQMSGGQRADPHSNPWADEEEEFGGGEKGMEMSFE
ncbi:hypothetical protein LTR33_006279 [Friedmanniomyces endolithicus]|nr:hypothetical protein LTR33_006279 [Friedmanniomyces endolithicus]